MKLRNSASMLLTLALAATATAASAQAQDASAAAPSPTADAATAAMAPAAEATPAAQPAPAAEASPAAAATPVAEAAIAAPTALSEKVAAAIGAPADGKALVVFFRPSKFTGAMIGFKVREAGVELGKLGNGSFFAVPVEPGAHSYVVHSEAKDVTNLEVEAGETYFLAGSISMGFMAGRPNLSPSDAAAFEAVLPKLKKSLPLN